MTRKSNFLAIAYIQPKAIRFEWFKLYLGKIEFSDRLFVRASLKEVRTVTLAYRLEYPLKEGSVDISLPAKSPARNKVLSGRLRLLACTT